MRQKILALSIAGVLASAGIASADPIMMGYYENWDYYATPSYSFDGATAGQNLDLEGKLGAVNAIAYAFLEVGSTGSVYLSDPWSDLANVSADIAFCSSNPSICSATGAVVPGSSMNGGNFDAFSKANVQTKLISIGGAGHEQSWLNAMANPAVFVASIQAIMKQYPGINGVDIDYEPQGGIPTEQAASFISLVTQLRQGLPSGAIITMAYLINPDSIANFGRSNWQALAKEVNYFGLMGYDMHGEFDTPPITDLQSALYDAGVSPTPYSDDLAVQAFNKMGLSDSQLILGFPSYGRAVSQASGAGLKAGFKASYQGDLDSPTCSTVLGSSNVCSGMMTYNSILATSGLISTVVNVDGQASGVYGNFGNNFVSYDDPQTLQFKSAYVMNASHPLAGMMVWALRFDAPITSNNSLLAAADTGMGITPHPYVPPVIGTQLQLTNTGSAGSAGLVVSLSTSIGGPAYIFPAVAGGSNISWCSKASASQSCQDSWNLDQLAGKTAVYVQVSPPGGTPLQCSGTLDLTKSYNQVMSYAGSNCQLN